MYRFGVLLFLTACYLLPTTISAVGEVDLLWQGETYTPPFYEGLPLWTNETRITFVAIPNLPNINPSTLIYRWSKDGTVLGSKSGVNVRSLTFSDTVLSQPVKVEIDIFGGANSDLLGSASVVLRPSPPKLIVVEDNPLYGLMLNQRIQKEFLLSKDEVTFSVLPAFSIVSTRSAPAFDYRWSTNTGDARTANTVTYRAPETGQGSSFVNLRAINSSIIVQPEPVSFLIKFNKQNEF